jgi:hypothetical protein
VSVGGSGVTVGKGVSVGAGVGVGGSVAVSVGFGVNVGLSVLIGTGVASGARARNSGKPQLNPTNPQITSANNTCLFFITYHPCPQLNIPSQPAIAVNLGVSGVLDNPRAGQKASIDSTRRTAREQVKRRVRTLDEGGVCTVETAPTTCRGDPQASPGRDLLQVRRFYFNRDSHHSSANALGPSAICPSRAIRSASAMETRRISISSVGSR